MAIHDRNTQIQYTATMLCVMAVTIFQATFVFIYFQFSVKNQLAATFVIAILRLVDTVLSSVSLFTPTRLNKKVKTCLSQAVCGHSCQTAICNKVKGENLSALSTPWEASYRCHFLTYLRCQRGKITLSSTSKLLQVLTRTTVSFISPRLCTLLLAIIL